RREVDTRQINTPGKLQSALRRLYSESGGILILDDVRDEDARILLPESLKWRVLITTRSESLGKSLKLKVRRLDALEPRESMELFRKVLGKDFDPRWTKDYQDLASFLAHRPYGIRLAAESLEPGLTRASPRDLLAALKDHPITPESEVDDAAPTVESLWPLLTHCLDQLKAHSPFARELLDYLAVCGDDG
ncbi:MAG: hypothetical protein GY859_23540, partial [Desulfobacterales bacterium]|nr:hypothetical protein [Desulfobacterales bacterium]